MSIPTRKEPQAKLWELLRRNACFKKAVTRLRQLDNRAQSDGSDATRQAWEIGDRMLRRIQEFNPFAADALRWLVPNPRTPPKRSAQTDNAWPLRWGPEVTRKSDLSPRVTLNTFWDETPSGFRQCFLSHWKELPEGNDEVWETDFFQGWDLVKLLKANLSKKDVVRIVKFRLLTQHRVFAVPRLLHRGKVKSIVKQFKKLLTTELSYKRELLGTGEFWRDFIEVHSIITREGLDAREAIRRYIGRTWGRAAIKSDPTCNSISEDLLREFFRSGCRLPKPTSGGRDEINEWRERKQRLSAAITPVYNTYRTTVTSRVDHMEKLVLATFPRLDWTTLTQKTPNKRTGKN